MEKIAAQDAKIQRLVSEIEAIRKTPITVQVLDPRTGKVVVEKAFPFGTPVRLILPTTKKE